MRLSSLPSFPNFWNLSYLISINCSFKTWWNSPVRPPGALGSGRWNFTIYIVSVALSALPVMDIGLCAVTPRLIFTPLPSCHEVSIVAAVVGGRYTHKTECERCCEGSKRCGLWQRNGGGRRAREFFNPCLQPQTQKNHLVFKVWVSCGAFSTILHLP